MKATVTGGTEAEKTLARINKEIAGKWGVFVGVPKGPRYTYRSGEQNRQGASRSSSHHKNKTRTPKHKGDASKLTPSVAEVAFINEFGSADGHIPERSFLRSTVLKNAKKYLAMNVKVAKRVLLGTITLKKGLGVIGAEAAGDVSKTIFSFSTPANAPSTVKRKGFNAPLRDTSLLAQSQRWEVKKG